ncbi:MAG: hypothetical protein WKG07_02760 [Hymenobacter sp.]
MSFLSNLFQSISAKNPSGGRGPEKPAVSVRERVSALRHLPAFLRLIWQTSPALTLGNIGLRLIRAALPLAMLYVGRLIIDDIVQLTKLPATARALPPCLGWWRWSSASCCWPMRWAAPWPCSIRCSATCLPMPRRCASCATPPSWTSTSLRTATFTTSWSAPAARRSRARC